MKKQKINYGNAIRDGFQYLLANYPEVFLIGQGLWSPWYVGSSMTDLEKEFGKERVMDSPVSELACTGAAVGAALCGYRPVVIHPRMDFMLLCSDQIINQAAKWSYMFAGQARPAVTIRGIVNRGGEQGAQHSQSLHAMYANIPGLKVVMPATTADARDLLIASVLSDDPVLYIDDRWLYSLEADLPPPAPISLNDIKPKCLRAGKDITLVGSSYSTELCLQAANVLAEQGVNAEVIDLRIINPLDSSLIVESVKKTGALFVVDGGWKNCGLAGEIIASVVESIDVSYLKRNPKRISLPDAPAPTAKSLEEIYYPTCETIVDSILSHLEVKVKHYEPSI
jgi:pyruvate/2-oxoglutarate/acetoin dehydrogenase E1 component